MSLPARIMVFAKAPVAGRVKTRLRGAYGAAGAAAAYRRLLARTVANAAAAAPARLEIWVAPAAGHPYLRRLARRHGARLRVQAGGDLGRRMHRALVDAVRAGEPGLIVGADCASLTPAELAEALAALRQGADLVVKPAEDGGYLLVGGRCAPARLFQGLSWGTAAVWRQTRSRLRRLGLETRVLAPGWDVDRPADLRRLAGFRLVGTGVGSPRDAQYPTRQRCAACADATSPRCHVSGTQSPLRQPADP